MIVKTPAVVLRRYPYTETSEVVAWLAPDYGHLNTLVKGAHRPKGGFLGQYDVFQTCELLFYTSPSDSLAITREVSSIARRSRLRSDWRACAIASYLCALARRAVPPKAPCAVVFDWLDRALDVLAGGRSEPERLCMEELKLLRRLGLQPRVGACLTCQAPLPDTGHVAFSAKEGGWHCVACAERRRVEDAAMARAEAIAAIARWLTGEGEDVATVAQPGGELVLEAMRLLGPFVSIHLEMPPKPRRAALECLSFKIPGSFFGID